MKYIRQFLIALLFGAVTFTNAQTLQLTVSNQQAVGTDFFFDIYLQATTGTVYLGGADFVLTFNSGNFSSPVLTNEGDSPGFCTFQPINNTAGNIFATQLQYFDNTACDILNSNELAINLNAPAPSTQTIFNNRVAVIDNTPSTHRLGRFMVSGITNPSGNMGLAWKTSGEGVLTRVNTFANTTPWAQTPVTLSTPTINETPLPVELTSFTSKIINDKVQLNWSTKTEINNFGFDVERKVNGDWQKIGFVNGNGNSNSPKEYTYTDKTLIGGSKFLYRLKQVDNDGQFEYSDAVEVEVVPNEYSLSQNYPNPFNPGTKIRYQLPRESKVVLKIYNILGSEVMELINEQKEAGIYEIEFNAESLASGTYIYKISADNFVQTKKMILLK